MAQTYKRKRLYAKIKLEFESTKTKTIDSGFVYTDVQVAEDLYSDNKLLAACNLYQWKDIKSKQAILPWDMHRVKLLESVRVDLRIKTLENEKRRSLRVLVSRLDDSMEAIASSILQLKKVTVSNEEWDIVRVIVSQRKASFAQSELEP